MLTMFNADNFRNPYCVFQKLNLNFEVLLTIKKIIMNVKR